MRIIEEIRGNHRKYILMLLDMLFFVVIDCVFYVLSTVGSLSNSAAVGSLGIFVRNSVIILASVMLVRVVLGIYRTVWRYTSTRSYFNLILSDLAGGILALLVMQFSGSYKGIWHCVAVVSLTAHASLLARLSYRLWYKKKNDIKSDATRKNTAIVGAGQLGTYLANDLRTNANSRFNPIFFIDLDRDKIGNTVAGLKVYDEEQAKDYIEKYSITDVIIAISDTNSERISRLYHFYRDMGCSVKIFDSLVHEGAEGRHGGVREFQIEDLLFRKPLKINDQKVLDYYAGRTVMVTGGGGSIGSELCRQIAHCGPKKLIVVDNYENNAYDIQQELIRIYGDKLDLDVEIASVQDLRHLEHVFSKYRPEIVFHAAAHKHVPLMEQSGYEAVKNNVLGTYNTANMAEKYGAEKFILISTDKAVNPTNVMGATKRVCEMIIQCRRDSATSFAAVRFGNVLGSNGSVIPLFKKQIAAGGPVTITDKRIIRYFMTIQEASQLVIQAGAMARRGELFVLDMGKPVKIYDLAVNMIKLSGLVPEVDIPIVEVGLRPGEKLYEELLIRTEELDKTENDMIFIERDAALTREEVEAKVRCLRKAAADWDDGNAPCARKILQAVVPTFCDPEELNRKAADAEEMQVAL
ncbi:MAG: polysaccharide biosynthesis protein [Oscillospiraceae bacterium]|nr:polysaccharide biosynthesis protein [Oscillospiraceae bacterium]